MQVACKSTTAPISHGRCRCREASLERRQNFTKLFWPFKLASLKSVRGKRIAQPSNASGADMHARPDVQMNRRAELVKRRRSQKCRHLVWTSWTRNFGQSDSVTVQPRYCAKKKHERAPLTDSRLELFFSIFTQLTSTLYPHAVGHYLGLNVHDTTFISRNADLAAGNVVTVEPGVYVPDSNKFPARYFFYQKQSKQQRKFY